MTKRASSSTVRPTSPPRGTSPAWPGWVVAGLVVLAVFATYGPALDAGFIWDDDGHLTRPDLQSLEGLGRIWFEIGATQQYYPLLHTAFWLEHRLWGDAPAGYHAITILWHALSACLFGAVLRRLAVPGAWLAAAVFALHPVCVESVAWVSEQKNTLSLLLYLGAALAYLRFHDEGRRGWYFVATAVFVLALLTKTVTATLPAALLVAAWWCRGRLQWRRDVLPLAPWFLLGIGGGILTAWFEHALIGAKGEAFALGPLERVLLAGRVVWFYLGKLAWPHPLIFVYPRWEVDASSWLHYLAPLAVLVVLGGLVVWVVRGGPRGPLAVALLFGGTLVPVLGFVNVYPFIYSYVADHFQYHASLAVFAGAAALATRLAGRHSRPAPLVLAAVLLAVLATTSWRQSRTYRDVFVLFGTTIARNPGAWMAHNNLGIALVDAGRATEALPHYREALRLKPHLAEVENNLGYALNELGRPGDAIQHLRRALQLKPDYLQARNNLAVALSAAGQDEESLGMWRETLSLYPDDGDAHFNLALALARAGRAAEALPLFEQAARIRPSDGKYVLHVAIALMFTGRFDLAEPEFRRALELDPRSATAHYTFGRALTERGRYRDGVELLKRAVQLDPGFAPAYHDLATALEAMGRFSEAERYRAEAPR